MNEESRLQFERYVQLVNRRKFVLAIPIVLGVLGALLLNYVSPRVYTATATARIDFSAVRGDTQDTGAAQRFINTYAEIIKTSRVTERVKQDLNLSGSSAAIAKRVTTAPIAGTELVTVTAKAPSGDEAAAIANDVANLLQDQLFISQFLTDPTNDLTRQVEATRQRLGDEQQTLAGLQSKGASAAQIASQQAVVDATQNSYQGLLTQLENARVKQGQASRAFSVIEQAEVPSGPSSPRWKFNLAAGLLAGLAGGIALSFVLEYIDPTLRGVRDLESATRLPVLASIPFGVRWKYPPPPVSPDYRLLATKLQTSLHDKQHTSVMFTSTREEEGNTTVATYAAMALAQAGLRVLLLDANLSRPDLHKLFNLPMAPGLYSFISQNGARPRAPMADAAAQIVQASPVPRLSVLTAGTKMNDPSELLASVEMRNFLDYLETEWDVLVIDGAAMTAGAGSAVLAPAVDGVVLVAAEGQASSKSVEDAVDELTSLGANTLGLVYCKATEA